MERRNRFLCAFARPRFASERRDVALELQKRREVGATRFSRDFAEACQCFLALRVASFRRIAFEESPDAKVAGAPHFL